jgi:hypothetical protein
MKEDPNKPGSDLSADSTDDLSFTGRFGGGLREDVWVEQALQSRSQIVYLGAGSQLRVDDAREPMLSADGQNLAYMRDDHGRGQMRMRRLCRGGAVNEVQLTPSLLNVYEASFLSEREYAFSAVGHGHPPQIYLRDALHANTPLELGESRYPALSPDGRWLAYSRFDQGGWNLWLRNEITGATRRVGNVPCNQIEPAWESDSKTLLYSTDCGRSLWFTAVARRRMIP